MTKQLKDYKCGEMLCGQCPLRVFGCAIAVGTLGLVKEPRWSQEMTLGEILTSAVDAIAPIAVDNPKLRRLLICCTTAARVELLGYIDEEEKNEAVERL